MIILKHPSTNELAIVDPAEGGGAPAGYEGWTLLRAVAAGETPELIVYDAVAGDAIEDLSTLELSLHAKIDREAEEVRLRFLTPGAGQAQEYLEAVAQAEALVAAEVGPFPMLDADVEAGTIDIRSGLAVASIAEAADLVLYMRSLWLAKGAAIREARLGAKAAVTAAAGAQAKIAAAVVDWEAVI